MRNQRCFTGRMRFAIAVVSIAVGLGLSGCPALMIPGLAYSAYNYEKGEPIVPKPQAQATTAAPTRKSSQTSSTLRPTDANTE